MMGTHSAFLRIQLFTILAAICVLVWASSSPAQTSKDRAQKDAAAQQAEADIRQAVREADRLAANSSEQAIKRLEKALTELDDATALSDARRDTLKRMLKDRIRNMQPDHSRDAKEVDKKILSATRRDQEKQDRAEKDVAKQLLDGIRQLQKEGKLDEASKLAKQLLERQPNSTAAQAASRTTATASQLAANRELQTERDRRVAGVLRDVDKTALPPKGDIEFPKDWKERTKYRKPETVRMTAKEAAILRALEAPISAKFKNSRLEDVLEYIQARTGQPIVLDPAAMEQAGVSYDSPVTVAVKGVSVRFLLRKILGDLGLTHIVKDEVIQVITPQQAKEMMSVQVYYIGDMVQNRLQAAYLIDLIQSTIEPESWKANGGQGTIIWHPLTHSLVIKQNAEFHSVLSSGLRLK